MKIFDYLYYRTYFAYMRKNEATPWIYATNLITLMQFLNLLVVFIIVNKFVSIDNNLKPFIIILFLLLFVVNYHRYKGKTYTKLNDLWNNENKKSRQRNGILIVLYILISILLPIIYSIFGRNL